MRWKSGSGAHRRVASVNIDPGFTVRREQRAGWFSRTRTGPVTGMDIRSVYDLPEAFIDALELRFANQPARPLFPGVHVRTGCGSCGTRPVALQTAQQGA